MNIKEERKAFDEQFGIDDANTFPAFGDGINSSAALKCNWLGWKARAEQEYKNNPEKIEIEGLKTIHKLCKFGAEHNMEGCSFTEIVERMFSELQAAKVPESNALLSAAVDAVQKLCSGDYVLMPKHQVVPETAKPSRCVTLTCAQLHEAFRFGAPDDADQEQLETEMTIAWSKDGHSGKGFYCYYADMPEEGAIFLDGEIEAQEQSND